MYIKRFLEKDLTAWKDSLLRKPLIVLGARQVGKTALLKEFGKNSFRKLHLFDFEAQPGLARIFEKDLDPSRILRELALQSGSDIHPHEDLIVFDEVQLSGRALTSLKYFCEQKDKIFLACAGSLLGLSLNDSSVPVGKVSILHLAPLCFEEFLLALHENQVLEEIQQSFLEERALSLVAHERLTELLKIYIFTGGLPEIVATFAENPVVTPESSKRIRTLQSTLIQLYLADMAKHSGKVNALHIERLWRSVPLQLANAIDGSTKKFAFKEAVPGLRGYERLAAPLDWLEKANLVLKVPIVENAEIPLKAQTKENFFKLYMFDVGLLGAMLQLDPYPIIAEQLTTFKGYLLENFVAQEISFYLPNEVFSWREKQSEVEFLIQKNGAPMPIEVKAGHNMRARSLSVFCSKYEPKASSILSANNLERHDEYLKNFPVYLAGRVVE